MGLRTELEELFGQHAFLTTQVMRARLRGDPDFAQATETAVSRNTDDLTAAVTRQYGPTSGLRFRGLWQAYDLALIDYARATAEHDQRARTRDSRLLAGYVGGIAGLLSTATRGQVSSDTVSTALGAHVTGLRTALDAYAGGDFARAYRFEAPAFGRMVGLGTTLSAAMTKDRTGQLPADFDSPVHRLQSALGGLLGVHFEVAIDAMRAGAGGSAEFPAAAAVLNGNTQDLAGAFAVLFGPAAAQRFSVLWGDHVDALVHYTRAVVTADAAGKTSARDDLASWEKQFAAFLATSTQGRLAAPALAQTLEQHDRELVQQIDAFTAKDYDRAHSLTFEGYQHMFVVAAELATAIGPTVAARLPRGGVQTGGGGTAG